MRTLGTLYERPAWVSNYPDQAAWKDYVSNVVARYDGFIDVWEIDNEPQSLMTAAQYATTLSNAVVTIRTVNPASRIGCFGGAAEASWITNVLGNLPANWITNCDVVTAHMYPTGESKTAAIIAAASPADVWNDESGSKTKGGQRTMDGNYIAYVDGISGYEDSQRYFTSLRSRVDANLQCLATSIGDGCAKYFYYDGRLWANDFDHQYSELEQDDTLRPVGVTLAVAEWMLRGLTNRASLGTATEPLYAFQTKQGSIAIGWSTYQAPRTRSTTLANKYRTIDTYGKVGSLGGNDITFGFRPVWLLATNCAWSDWTNGLSVAVTDGSDSTAPNLSVIGGWETTTEGVYPVRFIGIDDYRFPSLTNNGVLYRSKVGSGDWSDWTLSARRTVTNTVPFILAVQAVDDYGNTNTLSELFGVQASATINTLTVGTLNIGQ
jgi:hypothetical protein